MAVPAIALEHGADLEATEAAAAAERRAAEAECAVFRRVFAPRVRMSLLEWAESRRMLSPEANALAADAGGAVRYTTALTPYHRAPMEALADPATEYVVCMFPSQDGKTEILNNFIGWRIDIEPGPMLVLQPTKEMAEAWSKDRLAPMIRDTPALTGKVRDARSRDADNTILHKKFPGGHLTAVGSNSPAGLASRPIRDVAVDEVDRCAPSAGSEGDSLRLAFRRATTFRKGKKLLISSPTIKGKSRIYAEYMLGTQEELHVPCPECGTLQYLVWGGEDAQHGLTWDPGKPESAYYVCVSGCVIEEHHKAWMIERYTWVAKNPDAGPRRRSFRKNIFTSNLVAWRKLAAEWTEIQGKPEEEQQFVNTVCCELYDPVEGEDIDPDSLEARREDYPRNPDADPELAEDDPDAYLVPKGVGVLVRTVDVQGSWLETTVWGFGAGEEAWPIDTEVIDGDPATPVPWATLDRIRRKTYRHEAGATLAPAVTFVDMGGHHSKAVSTYTRERVAQHVYAIKGSSEEGAPLLGRKSRNNAARAIHIMVGSFAGKESVMARLARIKAPGPGYVHIPRWMTKGQLAQLTAERLESRVVQGRVKRVWKKTGRNEQLDLFVYALAALQLWGWHLNDKLAKLAAAVQAKGAELTKAAAAGAGSGDAGARRTRQRRPRPGGGGFVHGWK